MKNQSRPIVIVKRRKHKEHNSSHGGMWKIAYADFMTAMMALFLVLWLIATSTEEELLGIAEYFRDPLAREQRDEGSERVEAQLRMVEEEEKNPFDVLKEDLLQLVESVPKLWALREHFKIDLVREGLRIQIVDSQNRPMFKTGSAEVEPYMRDILRTIAPTLNSIPNYISLAGHTDSHPYINGEKGYSNWELSADRANASRRELMIGGLSNGKVLRVVGMAATIRFDGHGQDEAINRRISILVLNKQTERAILQESAEKQNKSLSVLSPPQVTAPAPQPPAESQDAPRDVTGE